MKWASAQQVEACKKLFRKVKLYYRCCKTDKALRDAVFERTGYDLDELEEYEADEILGLLKPTVDQQRMSEDGITRKEMLR